MTGSGAGFRQAGIDHVDLGADQVHLADGTTFFGPDAISKKRHEHIKVASVGNPGPAPGHPRRRPARHVRPAHRLQERKMGKLDIPPIPEFIGEFYACAAGARSSSPERAVTGGGLLS